MDFGIAKFRMRNFRIANLVLRNFRIAKLELALRNRFWHCEIAQCPATTVPLLLHPAASHPASTASHFLHFALVFLLIYGLFDG